MGFGSNSKKEFIKRAKGSRVICFGAGKTCEDFLNFLNTENISISYICDNDKMKWGEKIENYGREITIVSPQELSNDISDDFIIVITCKQVFMVYQQLLKMKINEACIYIYPFLADAVGDDQLMYEKRIAEPARRMLGTYLNWVESTPEEKEDYEKKLGKFLGEKALVMPYLTALITSRCSLKCRDCNNLMPFCNGGRNLDLNTILSNINKIKEVLDCCVCLDITGGEPFLHPNLGEIVSEVTADEKIMFVQIVTNGTVKPKTEWAQALSHPKVILRISEYPKYTKTNDVVAFCKENNIRFVIKKELQWEVSGGTERRNKKYEKIVDEYLWCWAGQYCKSIWDGKLYACARAAFLHDIKASDHASDYVDLDSEHLREDIMNHMISTKYVDACDFCDHMNPHIRTVEAAIQIGDSLT